MIHRLWSRTNPLSPEVVEAAQARTRDWLLADQSPDGYWEGQLEGDVILEAESIMLKAFLGREDDPICRKFAKSIRAQQLPDGGWPIHPGGSTDVSASVEAYLALKIMGASPDEAAMVRARAAILELGGVHACNSFTRFNLAFLGQVSYDECPCVPPELMLVPSRWRFSLYAMSAWTRTIVVPLSIISHFKPAKQLAPGRGIAELYCEDGKVPSRRTKSPVSWTNFFLGVDRALKLADRWVPASWRRPAVRAAHRWMLDHLENSDGLGAIFPPMVYTVIALKALDYEENSQTFAWAMDQLDDLIIEGQDGIRVQPCLSPVWDTAIAAISLADSDLPKDSPAIRKTVDWLIEQEIRRPGDWQVNRPGIEPSGWSFEFRNEFYPDIDDTAMVLLALHRNSHVDDRAVAATTRRGVNWLLAMQNRDGGWAAFDADIDNQVLTKVPFADHNAMLDPSCADITARILELLGTLGYRADHPSVARALDFLWKNQEREGCWYGRWGVNYIYGTWQVLQGLKALDHPMDHPSLVRAADWLESVQHSSGGWGESCRSYDDPAWMGVGEPTASQTAWAVLGLVAAGRANSAAVRRGIAYLTEAQRPDGSWDEVPFTGTGFPRVFYLKYHLYRIYFPLMAISRYRAAAAKLSESSRHALACRIPAQPSAHEC
jgi:squalene-hopene/tetraprenyl-beta-curcumene cyclase